MSIQITERSTMNLKKMYREVINFFLHELKINICSNWNNDLHGDNFEQISTMKLETGQTITISEPYVIYDGPFHYIKNTLENITYFSGTINISNLKEYTPVINSGDITTYLRENIDDSIRNLVKIAQENNEWIKNSDALNIMYDSIGSDNNINVNFIKKIHSQNPNLTSIEPCNIMYQTIIKKELTKIVIEKCDYIFIKLSQCEEYLYENDIIFYKEELTYKNKNPYDEKVRKCNFINSWKFEDSSSSSSKYNFSDNRLLRDYYISKLDKLIMIDD